jgi:hypothetical protein
VLLPGFRNATQGKHNTANAAGGTPAEPEERAHPAPDLGGPGRLGGHGPAYPQGQAPVGNPYVSLTYWDPQHEQAIVECRAEWQDEPATRARIWELFRTTPEPVGYDPKLFWPSVDDPGFGVLKLTPWRLEVWSLQAMAQGQPPRVWRPRSA